LVCNIITPKTDKTGYIIRTRQIVQICSYISLQNLPENLDIKVCAPYFDFYNTYKLPKKPIVMLLDSLG